MKIKIKNKPKEYNPKNRWGQEPFDDLNSAFDHNELAGEDEIKNIVLEFPGENDEYDWHWIVELKNGNYRYLWGGCDYTGWDCRSFLEGTKEFETIEQALASVPEKEEYTDRKPREVLIKQLNNELVFGTY